MKKFILILFAIVGLKLSAQSSYNLPVTWTSTGGSNFVFNVYSASAPSTNFTLRISVTNSLSATVPALPLNTPNWIYVQAFDKATGVVASQPSSVLGHSQLTAPPVPFVATTGIGTLKVDTSVTVIPPTP